jgi:SAM-dependent methyltransferase
MTLPTPLPRRINLGCGYDIRPGYLNVDFVERHGPDLLADVTSLPMLPDGWFEDIVANDVLEHIDRTRTDAVLAEWTRLLAPAGRIRIRVPSLLHLAAMVLAPENRDPDRTAGLILLMYGTQAYTGDYHLTSFTPATLTRHLANVGLYASAVGMLDGWMFEVDASRISVPPPIWPEPTIGQVEDLRRATIAQIEGLHRQAVAQVEDRHRHAVAQLEDLHRSTSCV